MAVGSVVMNGLSTPFEPGNTRGSIRGENHDIGRHGGESTHVERQVPARHLRSVKTWWVKFVRGAESQGMEEKVN